MYKKKLFFIFYFLGPTRINPRSYISPYMENQGYIVLFEKSIWKIIWKWFNLFYNFENIFI